MQDSNYLFYFRFSPGPTKNTPHAQSVKKLTIITANISLRTAIWSKFLKTLSTATFMTYARLSGACGQASNKLQTKKHKNKCNKCRKAAGTKKRKRAVNKTKLTLMICFWRLITILGKKSTLIPFWAEITIGVEIKLISKRNILWKSCRSWKITKRHRENVKSVRRPPKNSQEKNRVKTNRKIKTQKIQPSKLKFPLITILTINLNPAKNNLKKVSKISTSNKQKTQSQSHYKSSFINTT